MNSCLSQTHNYEIKDLQDHNQRSQQKAHDLQRIAIESKSLFQNNQGSKKLSKQQKKDNKIQSQIKKEFWCGPNLKYTPSIISTQLYYEYVIEYKLKGIARLNINLLQIYLVYFPYFKKKENQNDDKELSMYLVLFVKVVYIQILISSKDIRRSDVINKLYLQMFGTGKTKSNDYSKLKTLVKKQIEQFNKDIQKQIVKIEKDSRHTSDLICLRNSYIAETKNIQNNQILLREYWPIEIKSISQMKKNKKEILRYHAFRIEIFQKLVIIQVETRRDSLSNFEGHTQQQFMTRCIGITKNEHTFLTAKSNTVIKNVAKDHYNNHIGDQKVNIILTNRYSRNSWNEQIVWKINDVVRFRQEGCDIKLYNFQISALIKQIISNCERFYSNTCFYYPLISVQNLVVNLMNTKITAQFHKGFAIKQALCLHKKPYSIQNSICFHTPDCIQFQKSWQEYKEQTMILLDRKHMVPNHWYDCKYQKTQQDKQFYEKQSHILQKINSWRVLCVCYYIQHGRHYMQDQYRQAYGTAPLHLSKYLELLQAKTDLLQQSRKNLQHFLKPLSDQSLEKFKDDSTTQSVFYWTLREIGSFYEIFNDDSLLGEQKFQRIIREFTTRLHMIRQIINFLTNDYFFRKFYNVKKYIIVFYIELIEQVYQTSFMIANQKRKPGTRQQILKNLTMNKRINSNERKNLSKNSYQKLINQYAKRIESDHQKRYLQTSKILPQIEEMSSLSQQVKNGETLLFDIEIKIKTSLIQQKLDLLEKYEKIQKDVIQNCQIIYKKSVDRVKQILKNDSSFKENGSEFLKQPKDQRTLSQYNNAFKVFLKLVKLFITGYLKLAHYNFLKFQSLIIPIAVEEKDTQKKQKEQNLQKNQKIQNKYEKKLIDQRQQIQYIEEMVASCKYPQFRQLFNTEQPRLFNIQQESEQNSENQRDKGDIG